MRITALAAGETAWGTVTDPVTSATSAVAEVVVGRVGVRALLLQPAAHTAIAIEPTNRRLCRDIGQRTYPQRMSEVKLVANKSTIFQIIFEIQYVEVSA